MNATGLLKVHGLSESYFTGKLEAYLRAKGLAYALLEMDTRTFRRCARITGVAQMPQLELPDGRWLTDSTGIIEHFERELPSPAIYPADPALNFIADLLEDFGDEWLWRPAMYYRWNFAEDACLLSDRLARGMLRDVPLPLACRRWLIKRRQRQLFLKGDGITRDTAPLVEALYPQVLGAMSSALANRTFLLGNRPTQADMGFFGSMFRHFYSDPTAARIMRTQAPLVHAWVERLWKLQPAQFEQLPMPAELPEGLQALLKMLGEDYLPYLIANEQAVDNGAKRVYWQYREVTFNTPSSPYQRHCWQRLRWHYQLLTEGQRVRTDDWLGDSTARVLLSKTVLPHSVAKTPDNPAGKPLDSRWN